MIGHAALVGLFPQLAQGAQVLLHFSAPQFVAGFAFKQCLGLADQLFPQLVGTPSLPTFKLCGGPQRCVDLGFKLVANDAAVLFERVAQRIGGARAGFSVPFRNFKFQLGQDLAHGGFGLRSDFRV